MLLFAAGCLSAAIPGAGHLLRRLRLRGALWLAGWTIFLAISVVLQPWKDSDWLLVAIVLGFLVLTACSIDAAFACTDEDMRATRWAVALYACIALAASAYENMTCWRLAGFANQLVYVTQMEPTVQRGDIVIFDTHAYRKSALHRGDIVWMKNSSDPNGTVRRVIAVPGDTIEGKNGRIILNNVTIQESYVPGGSASIDVSASNDLDLKMLYNFESVKLGPDQFFVMGDNRAVSYDSRQTGPVNRSAIAGKALYIRNPNNSSRDGKPLE